MTFKELHNQKPTLQWKQRMDEGDDLFTDEILAETDKVLASFLNELENIKQPEEAIILKCVERAVLALNELNETYDDFIETEEREELYMFIVNAAAAAGFHTDEDITEDYREW